MLMGRQRSLLVLSAMLLLVGTTPYTATTPNRWALIVGINDYLHFGDEPGGDLLGAVNDALAMRDVLVARYGFPEENIRMLLDQEATREAIQAGLTQWLPSVVRPGDQVVFYFAGHGSQTWDETGEAEDGINQTICPTDVLRGSTDMDIVDKELGRWLRSLPTDQVTAILDSCHSGTATRQFTPFARPRVLGRNLQDLPRPATPSQVRTRSVGGAQATAARTYNPETDRVLEIAASRADEAAMDVIWPGQNGAQPTYGGAFTTKFVKHLWQVPAGTSYLEVFNLTVQDLKRHRFAQTPQISRQDARPLFAANAAPAVAAMPSTGAGAATPAGGEPVGVGKGRGGRGWVPVIAVSGTTVELAGGSAAGITPGAAYQVGNHLLTISSVSQNRARALVAGGAGGGGLSPGAQAQLVAEPFPEAVLRVSIAELVPEVRSLVERSTAGAPRLMLVDDPRAFVHLLLRTREGQHFVLGMDGAVRHTVRAPTSGAAAAALAEAILREAGAHQLAVLDNPAHPFPLGFAFAGDKQSFRLGEAIEFRVRVGHDGYLTIVDLGTDGTVTVIFPNEFERDNRVRAGQEVVLPSAAMRASNIVFEAIEPAGRGIVRAFLTERPLALPFSQGEASRAAAVIQALRQAAGTLPGAGAEAIPLGSWATSSIVYEITR